MFEENRKESEVQEHSAGTGTRWDEQKPIILRFFQI